MATINLVEEFDNGPGPKKKSTQVKVPVKQVNPDYSKITDQNELYNHMYAAHANYYKSQSLADKLGNERKILGVPYKRASQIEKILSDKTNIHSSTIDKIRNNSLYNDKDYFDFRDKKDKIPEEFTYRGTDGAGNVRDITVRPYEKTSSYIPYTTDVGTKGVLEYPTYEKARRNYLLNQKRNNK